FSTMRNTHHPQKSSARLRCAPGFSAEWLIATERFALCCTPETLNGIRGRLAMAMSVGQLDHYNVSTRKLKETIDWYVDVLGFVNGPRPQFSFPGAWLYSEGHPVLHLNDISQTDRDQRPDSGVIDHVAFGSRGFEAMKKHLTGKGITFRI